MNIRHIPLLQIQRDLHEQPRNMARVYPTCVTAMLGYQPLGLSASAGIAVAIAEFGTAT